MVSRVEGGRDFLAKTGGLPPYATLFLGGTHFYFSGMQNTMKTLAHNGKVVSMEIGWRRVAEGGTTPTTGTPASFRNSGSDDRLGVSNAN